MIEKILQNFIASAPEGHFSLTQAPRAWQVLTDNNAPVSPLSKWFKEFGDYVAVAQMRNAESIARWVDAEADGNPTVFAETAKRMAAGGKPTPLGAAVHLARGFRLEVQPNLPCWIIRADGLKDYLQDSYVK